MEMKPAFKMVDTVLELCGSKEVLQTRLRELAPQYRYEDSPKGWTAFLLDYMGVLDPKALNESQISDEARWNSVTDIFLDNGWKKMTHKYLLNQLGWPTVILPD